MIRRLPSSDRFERIDETFEGRMVVAAGARCGLCSYSGAGYEARRVVGGAYVVSSLHALCFWRWLRRRVASAQVRMCR